VTRNQALRFFPAAKMRIVVEKVKPGRLLVVKEAGG